MTRRPLGIEKDTVAHNSTTPRRAQSIEKRGRGYGPALLVHLAQTAQQRDCARVERTVLNGNEQSIRFYRPLGAVPMPEGIAQPLDAAAIPRVAALSTTTSA
ncbi:GNAT family N-acetyltransferase [Pseudoclavibacter sp. 13-3]|uniref:GNAT family N-acetyltransferase n=1 Tax=Pseudoclavibacter sp. 13-3 TaxID=2901228 RepID=UPI001E62BCC5|nr:GNAT family N-acetyltransferase [Pseudoclavibacter sp. 13-3]MCD7101431.1 GNAT family N-acetyltransferase [Pseudoclavibacter sp. 13-3]